MSLFEFRDFASKGNAVDRAGDGAVALASSAIVTSLGDGLPLPVAGLVHGQHDASEPVCRGQTERRCSVAARLARGRRPAALNIGLFINAVVEFAIVAFGLFLVEGINAIRNDQAAARPLN